VPFITFSEVTPVIDVELADALVADLPVSVRLARQVGVELWGDDPFPADLEQWLSWEIEGSALKRNNLGFGGLFFSEWCDEEFRVSHAPDAAVEAGSHVVKGGGAQFCPWQDEEWVWCAPAIRMPSSGLDPGHRCGARLVLDLA